MAKKLDPLLLEILTTYGERPEEALWDCHGTWVAYHKAIERIAARAGITFDMPTIIEADSASKTVAIAVRGFMGEDRAEWSFGEAAPSNNKNAYPYAMAEKRAKDRVVLKLVGLHVYSEEESDDFKPQKGRQEGFAENPAPAPEDPKLRDGLKIYKQTGRTSSSSLKQDKSPDNWGAFEQELAEVETVAGLTKFAMAWSSISERDIWPTSWHNLAKAKINERREELINGTVPDDDVFPGDRKATEG